MTARDLIGLQAAIEAGAIGEAQWRDWADRAMLESPQVPAWLLDLSAATQSRAALAALAVGSAQTTDSTGAPDRTSAHLGFLRLRHERGEIGLAELLERAGRVTDAANYDEPECEAFYLLLNEIDQGGPTQPSPRPLGERAAELFEGHARLARVLLEELALQPAGTGGPGLVNAASLNGGPRRADFLGSITAAPDAPGIDLERWKLLIAKHPNLVPVPSREGINPFTRGTFTYRAHPGDALVVVAGSEVGTMSWAQDGTNRIAVGGDATFVEPIAIEVASELGGVYQRGEW